MVDAEDGGGVEKRVGFIPGFSIPILDVVYDVCMTVYILCIYIYICVYYMKITIYHISIYFYMIIYLHDYCIHICARRYLYIHIYIYLYIYIMFFLCWVGCTAVAPQL